MSNVSYSPMSTSKKEYGYSYSDADSGYEDHGVISVPVTRTIVHSDKNGKTVSTTSTEWISMKRSEIEHSPGAISGEHRMHHGVNLTTDISDFEDASDLEWNSDNQEDLFIRQNYNEDNHTYDTIALPRTCGGPWKPIIRNSSALDNQDLMEETRRRKPCRRIRSKSADGGKKQKRSQTLFSPVYSMILSPETMRKRKMWADILKRDCILEEEYYKLPYEEINREIILGHKLSSSETRLNILEGFRRVPKRDVQDMNEYLVENSNHLKNTAPNEILNGGAEIHSQEIYYSNNAATNDLKNLIADLVNESNITKPLIPSEANIQNGSLSEDRGRSSKLKPKIKPKPRWLLENIKREEINKMSSKQLNSSNSTNVHSKQYKLPQQNLQMIKFDTGANKLNSKGLGVKNQPSQNLLGKKLNTGASEFNSNVGLMVKNQPSQQNLPVKKGNTGASKFNSNDGFMVINQPSQQNLPVKKGNTGASKFNSNDGFMVINQQSQQNLPVKKGNTGASKFNSNDGFMVINQPSKQNLPIKNLNNGVSEFYSNDSPKMKSETRSQTEFLKMQFLNAGPKYDPEYKNGYSGKVQSEIINDNITHIRENNYLSFPKNNNDTFSNINYSKDKSISQEQYKNEPERIGSLALKTNVPITPTDLSNKTENNYGSPKLLVNKDVYNYSRNYIPSTKDESYPVDITDDEEGIFDAVRDGIHSKEYISYTAKNYDVPYRPTADVSKKDHIPYTENIEPQKHEKYSTPYTFDSSNHISNNYEEDNILNVRNNIDQRDFNISTFDNQDAPKDINLYLQEPEKDINLYLQEPEKDINLYLQDAEKDANLYLQDAGKDVNLYHHDAGKDPNLYLQDAEKGANLYLADNNNHSYDESKKDFTPYNRDNQNINLYTADNNKYDYKKSEKEEMKDVNLFKVYDNDLEKPLSYKDDVNFKDNMKNQIANSKFANVDDDGIDMEYTGKFSQEAANYTDNLCETSKQQFDNIETRFDSEQNLINKEIENVIQHDFSESITPLSGNYDPIKIHPIIEDKKLSTELSDDLHYNQISENYVEPFSVPSEFYTPLNTHEKVKAKISNSSDEGIMNLNYSSHESASNSREDLSTGDISLSPSSDKALSKRGKSKSSKKSVSFSTETDELFYPSNASDSETSSSVFEDIKDKLNDVDSGAESNSDEQELVVIKEYQAPQPSKINYQDQVEYHAPQSSKINYQDQVEYHAPQPSKINYQDQVEYHAPQPSKINYQDQVEYRAPQPSKINYQDQVEYRAPQPSKINYQDQAINNLNNRNNDSIDKTNSFIQIQTRDINKDKTHLQQPLSFNNESIQPGKIYNLPHLGQTGFAYDNKLNDTKYVNNRDTDFKGNSAQHKQSNISKNNVENEIPHRYKNDNSRLSQDSIFKSLPSYKHSFPQKTDEWTDSKGNYVDIYLSRGKDMTRHEIYLQTYMRSLKPVVTVSRLKVPLSEVKEQWDWVTPFLMQHRKTFEEMALEYRLEKFGRINTNPYGPDKIKSMAVLSGGSPRERFYSQKRPCGSPTFSFSSSGCFSNASSPSPPPAKLKTNGITPPTPL